MVAQRNGTRTGLQQIYAACLNIFSHESRTEILFSMNQVFLLIFDGCTDDLVNNLVLEIWAFVFLLTPAFRRIRHATATNRRIQHSPVFEEIYFTSSARINFSPNPLHDLTGNRTEKAQLMIELNRRSWKLRIDYKFRNCISKFFYTCLFDFSQEKLDNIQ